MFYQIFFVLITAMTLSLHSMEDQSIQFSNICSIKHLKNNILFLHSDPGKGSYHQSQSFLYNIDTKEKILLEDKTEGFTEYFTNEAHTKFGIVNRGNASLQVHDFTTKEISCCKIPYYPCDFFFDDNRGDILMCCTTCQNYIEKLNYRTGELNPDGRFEFFWRQMGALCYYGSSDKIVCYDQTKKGFYYGKIESLANSTSHTFKDTRMHYLTSHVFCLPLLVYFTKNRDSSVLATGEKVNCCNRLSVLNVFDKSCISINHPEIIVSVAIHPKLKYLATLSKEGVIRFIDIVKSQCVRKMSYAGKKNLFSQSQLDLRANLLSFSLDGKFLRAAFAEKCRNIETPFLVQYGMTRGNMMAMFYWLARNKCGVTLPKDIRQLIMLKIIA